MESSRKEDFSEASTVHKGEFRNFLNLGVAKVCTLKQSATVPRMRSNTGEAIQGGSEKVGWKCTRLWGTSNCQEMLQADLQKLKEDRKNLRKAIRNNQKEARKQAKRKQRLVKAVLTVVFVFLPPVLAAGRQDVVEGRPGAVDSGQTGGFHLTMQTLQ